MSPLLFTCFQNVWLGKNLETYEKFIFYVYKNLNLIYQILRFYTWLQLPQYMQAGE